MALGVLPDVLADQRLKHTPSLMCRPIFLDREVKLAGELDAEAFLPYVDTISGSRWPGENGGPRRG